MRQQKRAETCGPPRARPSGPHVCRPDAYWRTDTHVQRLESFGQSGEQSAAVRVTD